ncbi:Solute:Sodium symporter family [Tribonema minus]|uniref:Solute:Sodium symporter family n=1 Tax=Tribonema minus TaxID=303371 RepID=A0A835YRZ9_9STRA|nr:Solute:Sodium symporter family [Tribonema minus]
MSDACTVAGSDVAVAADSCCQKSACNIPCPAEWSPSANLAEVYGVANVCAIAVYCLIGFYFLWKVRGKVENYFVAGRSLNLFVATLALAGQSIDSNATLGNADLAYKFAWFDGAALPIGLGVSLILNGLLLARHVNNACCLTLPDFYARKYGKLFEVLVSLVLCTSFISLLAGNLVGLGRILQFCFGGISKAGGVWVAAALCASYTIGGGLVSVVYADVVQALTGVTGLIVFSAYMLSNYSQQYPPASVGFPGYIYPDQQVCEMYNGVPGTEPETCVYNEQVWGPNGVDNGAWPVGDALIHPESFTSFDGLAPFPNAVYYNWATVIILGFGNLSALDFQARCMAAKTPRIATIACLLGGLITFAVGIPFAFNGGFMKVFYGPDSIFAEYAADTCSSILGLPTCAEWLPDEDAFLKLATSQVPVALGAWCLIGIVAASMSTATGVILAIATVLSHNVGKKAIHWFRPTTVITEPMLLIIVRVSVPIVTIIAAIVAAEYNRTGYLLVVAFDIALAGSIAPLLALVYTPNSVTPGGGVCGLLAGILTRVILEYALPKDGSLILPAGNYAYGYGPGQAGLPLFVEAPAAEHWDPETCDATALSDFTGVDSLVSPIVCALVMYAVSWAERRRGGRPLLNIIPATWLSPVAAPKNVEQAVAGEVTEAEMATEMAAAAAGGKEGGVEPAPLGDAPPR